MYGLLFHYCALPCVYMLFLSFFLSLFVWLYISLSLYTFLVVRFYDLAILDSFFFEFFFYDFISFYRFIYVQQKKHLPFGITSFFGLLIRYFCGWNE